MKAKEFQSFVEQLSELSAAQRDTLVAALQSEAPADGVIAMIGARFAAAPACGHCRSERIGGWGQAGGLRRYKCKDCRRTFNALTGTPLAQLHKREAWLDYARALVDRVSLRKAAGRSGIDLTTSFRWRHRFLEAGREAKPAKVEGIVEADETFFLRSAKGSKKLYARAPRKRGTKAKKPGLSTEYVPVLIVRDRHGATRRRAAQSRGRHDQDLSQAGRGDRRPARFGRSQGLWLLRQGNRHRTQGRGRRARTACRRGRLSHPERQRLHEPIERLDASLQWRRDQVSQKLSRLAPHDRAGRRSPHAATLIRMRLMLGYHIKAEQSLDKLHSSHPNLEKDHVCIRS